MVDSDAVRIEKAIRKVQESGDESALIEVLLKDALNWPLADDDDENIEIDDISYSWNDVLVEMGFSTTDAPIELRQVMPFPNWPHGIFIVKFGSSKFFTQGRGMTTPLRTILRELMEKVRPTADHPSWKRDHLLFLCHSETDYFQFARFEDPKGDSKTSKLQMFGWGPNDHIRTICEYNLKNLIYKHGMNEEEATEAVASAFDVSKVSKKFYEDYKKAFENAKPIIEQKSSLTNANEIHQTTQTLFNRILFLRFIEKKGWLHFGETDDYLRELFNAGGAGSSTFYSSRLKRLFFEGLAIEGKQNDPAYGEVAFLNGGLFEESKFDKAIKDLPDELFEPLLGEDGLFYNYNFTVQESTPLDIDVAIDPEMIGTMFEELVTGRDEKGAFYTPKHVVSYMCRESIKTVISNKTTISVGKIVQLIDDNNTTNISIPDARKINQILSNIKAIDPACGSGAYLLGLLQELIRINDLLITITNEKETRYEMKLRIISRSIFGVDIEGFATNIAMLRLWLSLAVDAPKPEPLPNLDFNIETGDSLLAPNPKSYQMDLLSPMILQEADALALKKERYLSSKGAMVSKLRKEIKKEEQQILLKLPRQNRDANSVDFRVHFASVFTSNLGFDIVLANPPYINSRLMARTNRVFRDSIASSYEWTTGSWDIYVAFMELGFRITNSTGVLTVITPDKWLGKDFGKALRVATHPQISTITRLGNKIFESATVDAIITTYSLKGTSEIIFNDIDIDGMSTIRVVEKSTLNLPYTYDWLFSDNIGLLKKIDSFENKFIRIGLCENACATNDAYKLKELVKEGSIDSQLDDHYRLVNTGTIGRYYAKWGDSKLTYLGSKYQYPIISKSEFNKKFPNKYGRISGKKKIIIKGLNLLDACPDFEGRIIPGIPTLIATAYEDENMKLLLCLMNSKICRWYFKEKYPSFNYIGATTFTPDMINELPLPQISDKNRNDIYSIIDLIIDIKSTDSTKDTKPLEEKIEYILFDCYNLTKNEIDIING